MSRPCNKSKDVAGPSNLHHTPYNLRNSKNERPHTNGIHSAAAMEEYGDEELGIDDGNV